MLIIEISEFVTWGVTKIFKYICNQYKSNGVGWFNLADTQYSSLVSVDLS
jgi:hypothetical protein